MVKCHQQRLVELEGFAGIEVDKCFHDFGIAVLIGIWPRTQTGIFDGNNTIRLSPGGRVAHKRKSESAFFSADFAHTVDCFVYCHANECSMQEGDGKGHFWEEQGAKGKGRRARKKPVGVPAF